jgi:hypothetical protein
MRVGQGSGRRFGPFLSRRWPLLASWAVPGVQTATRAYGPSCAILRRSGRPVVVAGSEAVQGAPSWLSPGGPRADGTQASQGRPSTGRRDHPRASPSGGRRPDNRPRETRLPTHEGAQGPGSTARGPALPRAAVPRLAGEAFPGGPGGTRASSPIAGETLRPPGLRESTRARASTRDSPNQGRTAHAVQSGPIGGRRSGHALLVESVDQHEGVDEQGMAEPGPLQGGTAGRPPFEPARDSSRTSTSRALSEGGGGHFSMDVDWGADSPPPPRFHPPAIPAPSDTSCPCPFPPPGHPPLPSPGNHPLPGQMGPLSLIFFSCRGGSRCAFFSARGVFHGEGDEDAHHPLRPLAAPRPRRDRPSLPLGPGLAPSQ